MEHIKFNKYPETKPSPNEDENQFLVKIENTCYYTYEIAEWHAINEYNDADYFSTKPMLNTSKVIGWAKIYDYFNDIKIVKN